MKQEEEVVFKKLSNGKTLIVLGKHKVMIESKEVHYRFKAFSQLNPNKFPFNINPNTLDAHYELFICGSEYCYYLIPIDIIKKMYFHPNAYPDRLHPNITIITIDIFMDNLLYAKPSLTLDLSPYKYATL